MITLKIISLGFLSLGVFFLMQIVLPYFSFKIWETGIKYQSFGLISPQSSNKSKVLGVSLQNDDNFSYFVSDAQREESPPFLEFRISVPKLKLEKVEVLVDSNDLTKSLAHLSGTALPGEKGNVFISGHSSLNFLRGIKDTPFANLQDMKKGDQIEVWAGGTKFTYEVEELKVVNPSDTSVISAPQPNGRYISLMTCVPPGLNFKRLIVLGKMI